MLFGWYIVFGEQSGYPDVGSKGKPEVDSGFDEWQVGKRSLPKWGASRAEIGLPKMLQPDTSWI